MKLGTIEIHRLNEAIIYCNVGDIYCNVGEHRTAPAYVSNSYVQYHESTGDYSLHRWVTAPKTNMGPSHEDAGVTPAWDVAVGWLLGDHSMRDILK